MAKHTPGTWTIERPTQYEGRTDRILVGGNGESLMGDPPYYPWVPDSEEDWALISSAPELLAALEDEHLSELQGRNGCTNGPSCSTCALISKAKGGSE